MEKISPIVKLMGILYFHRDNWCQTSIIVTGFIFNGNYKHMNSVSTALLTSHVIDFNSLSQIYSCFSHEKSEKKYIYKIEYL